MAGPELSQRMSSTDAAFLYTEQPTAPMHIAGLSIVDGDVNEDDLKRFLDSKMHLMPRYRQRIHAAPMNVGHPSWHDDPDFHIDNHVETVVLPEPGNLQQLQRAASENFAGMLDRDKPLWKAYLIKGFEGTKTAMLWLVHHCMVDGVSGAELMRATFDPSPDAKIEEPPPFLPTPREETDRERWQAVWEGIGDQVEAWSDFQRNWVSWARNLRVSKTLPTNGSIPSILREISRPSKRLPFNCYNFSGKRRLAWTTISFAEARAIRGACGGTVNDVVLATLGGAVQKYAIHHGIRVKRMHIRVMVPVSLRQESERGALGNKVSLLPVDIPLDMDNPLDRLNAVTDRTNLLKRTKVADLLNLVTQGWQGTTPPALQALLGSIAFAQPTQNVMNVAQRSPAMHMVCTNVPGPQIPLYMMGHRLLHHFPLLPVTPGMGLNVGVFSYNQLVHFGFIADSAAARDISRFRDFFAESFEEIRIAAGVQETEPINIKPRKKRAAKKKKTAAKAKATKNGSPSNGTAKKKPRAAVKPKKAKAKTKLKAKVKAKAKLKAKAKAKPKPRTT
jgi:WS/DGAT/MGAT family acyltransferase